MKERNMLKAKHFIMDMDGVIVRGSQPVPGAAEFIKKLQAGGIKFLVLTNNSIYTPRDLANRLRFLGIDVPDHLVYTSAIATARFLHSQRPNGTAFAIGEAGAAPRLVGLVDDGDAVAAVRQRERGRHADDRGFPARLPQIRGRRREDRQCRHGDEDDVGLARLVGRIGQDAEAASRPPGRGCRTPSRAAVHAVALGRALEALYERLVSAVVVQPDQRPAGRDREPGRRPSYESGPHGQAETQGEADRHVLGVVHEIVEVHAVEARRAPPAGDLAVDVVEPEGQPEERRSGDEPPALEQRDLAVQGALRQASLLSQGSDAEGAVMPGQGSQHIQHAVRARPHRLIRFQHLAPN